MAVRNYRQVAGISRRQHQSLSHCMEASLQESPCSHHLIVWDGQGLESRRQAASFQGVDAAGALERAMAPASGKRCDAVGFTGLHGTSSSYQRPWITRWQWMMSKDAEINIPVLPNTRHTTFHSNFRQCIEGFGPKPFCFLPQSRPHVIS